MSRVHKFLKKRSARRAATRRERTARFVAGFEPLEPRLMLSVSAFFSAQAGTLNIFGDNLDNTIEVSRDAAGTLLVNGGAVTIQGGTATVANTTTIASFGLGGNDSITLNEANGALPRALLFGGTGNDKLQGGTSNDQLFGQSGNDTIQGRGGSDFLFGGGDNDTLTGGDSDDQVFGESGNDRMIWNPGDDTDLNEGGAGTDTVEVNGGNGTETFTATANGTRVRFDRVDPAPFVLDIGTSENLVVNAKGGDDSFAATGNLAALIQITVDGGAGNDALRGGNGADVLLGGDGNDFIDGNQGNDVALMGAGDDIFQWDPGDGSDTVEGQAGSDTMLFNGSNASENIDIAANGGRVRFFRDVANITMDLDDVERIDFNALGGADNIVVGDLSGTDVTTMNLNLVGAVGGTGDGQPDTVTVNGTNANDTIAITGTGSSVAVTGLTAKVNITNAEGANDRLTVNGLGGADNLDASGLAAGVIGLQLNGGLGIDVLLGSQGNDTVNGGDGDDVALLGAGDDVFVWNPGDDNDTIEGQAGTDTMLFNGANVSENIDISANGGRVRFFRNVANVVMDLNDVEHIDFNAFGGADTVVINDLSGTDITEVNLNLAAFGGVGDGQPDTVIVNGTNGDDVAQVTGDAGGVAVTGLAARVNITGAEAANDRLTINTLAGDDVVEASGLAAGAIQLTADGGDGDDVLIGGAGDDILLGGAGDDVLLGGPGLDVLDGGPGDNILIQ